MMPAASRAALIRSFVWVFICESGQRKTLYERSRDLISYFGGKGTKWPFSVASRCFAGQSDPMPELESVAPEASPQSLARRAKRNENVLAACRLTMPGRMVLSARRELEIVHQEAASPGLSPTDRACLVSTSVKLRDQLMDLLSLPKRPAAAGKGKLSAPMLDVSPTAPDLT